MARRVLDFANLLMASLVVGAMFGIWLNGNLVDLSPSAYVQNHQHMTNALNVAMPMLGWFVALLTLWAAILGRMNRRRCGLLLVALACFILAGLVTRFLNQPINALVMTWSPENPPDVWMDLRDQWWRWHTLRTVLGLVGLSLLIGANLVGDKHALRSG